MIRKFTLLILLIMLNTFYSQQSVLEKYPVGQEFYAGGNRGLLMEMIQLAKSKNLSACENKEDKYMMPILVNANGSINYVKDDDTLKISQNKCAYDFGRKIFPSMKRWMPAKSNNQNVGAIVNILVDPFFLLNSKEDPDKNIYIQPKFKKGIERFHYEVKRVFERQIKENQNKYTYIVFSVNENGKMADFSIEGEYSEFEIENLVKDLSRINIQLEPGTFNNIPLKSKMRLPVRQEFSLEVERKKIEDEFKRMNSKFR